MTALATSGLVAKGEEVAPHRLAKRCQDPAPPLRAPGVVSLPPPHYFHLTLVKLAYISVYPEMWK